MKRLLSLIKKEYKAIYKKGALHIFAGSFLTKFVAFFGSVFIVRVLQNRNTARSDTLKIYIHTFIYSHLWGLLTHCSALWL
jgi:hypothetical protein